MQITPQILLNAYCQGIFPMAEDNGDIYWYDPDPRTIIPLDKFHTPRRLARTIRRGGFDIRIDKSFQQVMEACAQPTPNRESTWINDEIIEVYCVLHNLGFAHSVEIWQSGQLMGGLYGVAVRGLFAGESMFSRATDSSKIALVYLVEHLKKQGLVLLDIQFMTEHLRRFGAIEIPEAVYKQLLARALRVDTQF